MNKPFLDKLRKIDPYVPGEQPKTANVIKLNANENPYPPAPGVTEVLRTFDAAKLAVYPDANAKALKTALAEREGLQAFAGFPRQRLGRCARARVPVVLLLGRAHSLPRHYLFVLPGLV